MASDISRKIFNPKKHYSGVLMQQGRVQLDSDWNEQLDVQLYRTHTETKDVIGLCGVPKKGDSFKIVESLSGQNIFIFPGRIYVGGLLCELGLPVSYLNQPYYPNPKFQPLSNAPGSPPSSPPSGPPLDLPDGRYIVYIDAWQRTVNYLDDPRIQEVALGEADTTTRLQNVWQVKLFKTEIVNADCKTDTPDWNEHIAPTTGRLNVQTKKVVPTDDPCILPSTAGYKRLENQTYRVEVQTGGDLEDVTFKWSRDNASVETKINKINGSTITVGDIGKDGLLGFATGQWVEIVDEESNLKSTPHPLIQILSVNPSTREIILDITSIPVQDTTSLKLRRWDQSGLTAAPTGITATTGWMDLEGGIQVSFSSGTYKAGDYWLIPARVATSEVEWPPYEIPNLNPLAQPPMGIHHQYCKLAVLDVSAGIINVVDDCRPKFPTLTEICAEDICYDNSNCDLSQATTVQEALDQLCSRNENKCTFTAIPGPGWERVFDLIGDRMDAQICFQVGVYPLDRPLRIINKGNLKIEGCGPGSKIIATKAEAGLVFENCRSVLIQDLSATTGKVGNKTDDNTKHLNGTLTFLNCPEVNVQQVHLKCGAGTIRAATCITIRNQTASPGLVRIQDSELQIGYLQQGILLVNTKWALVQGNTLSVYKKPSRLRFAKRMQNKVFRANVRKNIFSNQRSIKGSKTNVSIRSGTNAVFFKTPPLLKKGRAFENMFVANPPANTRNTKDLIDHAKKLTDRMLIDETFRRGTVFENFFDTLARQDPSVASQGITVAGRVGKDVRILNNTMDNMLQGIHVGLSHSSARNIHDHAKDVLIAGNNICITLPISIGNRGRHGIFVGNCKSLVIENNNIQLKRTPDAARITIDGIRVWGILGNRLMITKNHVFSEDGSRNSFNTGIRVNPIRDKTNNDRWVVMWNVAPSKQTTVTVRNGAEDIRSTNTP